MKQGNNSYSQGETFQLNEVRTTNVNRVIIVPYGYPYRFDITEARQGDTIVFKDGKEATVEGVCTLATHSPAFDTVCQMVFGLPAVQVVSQWRDKYKNDIQYDNALIIVYNAELRQR